MDGDQLLPDDVNAAMNPLASFSALTGLTPSSLPPPSAAYAPRSAPTSGLANLNSYIANRYSPENQQGISDRLDAANQGLASILSNPATDEKSKWFAAAAALGRPTRSGQFLEAASNGLDAINSQESADFQKREEYKLKLAQMIQQRAQQQYDQFQSGSQQAQEKAAQIQMTAARGGVGVDGVVTKVVPGVGMVSRDPSTGMTTVDAGSRSPEFQKYYLAFSRQATDDLNMSDSSQIDQYATQQALSKMSAGGRFSTIEGVSGAPSSAGIASPGVDQLVMQRDAAAAAGNYKGAMSLQSKIDLARAQQATGNTQGSVLPAVMTSGNTVVPPSVQAARDSDRIKIFNDEIAAEPDPTKKAALIAERDNGVGNGRGNPMPVTMPANSAVPADAPVVPVAQVTRKLSFPKDAAGNIVPLAERGVPGAPVVASSIVGADGQPMSTATDLSDAAMDDMATRLAHGDTSVLLNVGRGAQGAQQLVKIRNKAADIARAEGISADAQTANVVQLGGEKAGARTLGTRVANLQVVANELNNFGDQAIAASNNVPRGSFVPLNKAIQMVQAGTSSPELATFVAKNEAVINSFSALAGKGTPTVTGSEHARQLLSTATDAKSYEAKVRALQQEAAGANNAGNEVQAQQRNRITGGTPKDTSAIPAFNSKGWALHVDASGNKAYVSGDGKQYEEVK